MESTQILAVVSIVIGLIAMFFGKSFYRIVLGLSGVVLGWAAGHAIADAINQTGTVQLILGIVGAILVGVLLYWFYGLAFALFGAIFGAAFGIILLPILGVTGIGGLLVVVVGAVLGAIVGTLLKDPVIVIGSAFGGATAVVTGVGTLAPTLPLVRPGTGTTESVVSLAVVVVLTVIGAVFQFRSRRI
ncbi:MAG: DUF4203 domain-containing protein [Chloroflexi bacterium]|nr:DUF4203 domain-containing protein [Chloroflexota bacterium]